MVLLDNAAGVIFDNNDVLTFLEPQDGAERSAWEIQHSGDTNKLLSAIRDGHKNNSKLAGCKALALLGVAVSHPLMKAVKENEAHVLDMNPRYREMREKFRSWSADASKVVSGEDRLFLDIPLSQGGRSVLLRNALHAFKECDVEVQQILELSFCVLCGMVERLLPDHFDNGKFADPTAKLRQETSACPRNNDAAERDFASLDRRLREMPNATTRCLEGIIMFANNDTAEWLNGKSEQEQAQHLKAARTLKPDIIATCKKRKLEMRKLQNEDLAKKKIMEAERMQKLRQEQEVLASSTALWVTRDQVFAELEKISIEIVTGSVAPAGSPASAAASGEGEALARSLAGAAASGEGEAGAGSLAGAAASGEDEAGAWSAACAATSGKGEAGAGSLADAAASGEGEAGAWSPASAATSGEGQGALLVLRRAATVRLGQGAWPALQGAATVEPGQGALQHVANACI
ncbi:hypothetical protein CYMTET_6739 [Cymbomonas tetramitiformis]|uniref:Uncharacterized protein n=1 Tax=Cymbomonas tetramitiformis TaxID=36881 RepID=A0AAE0LI45_9CHLO|nr:hypothetical protein CYMTET_6739 [Cymbomonas tetramitiformis]